MWTIALRIFWLMGALGFATRADAGPETCGQFKFCTRHFSAIGACDGLDQIPILAPPWEDRPITIRRVTVGIQLHTGGFRDLLWPPFATIFAGNSYVPDIMALRIGQGTKTEIYPPDAAFSLPAKQAEGTSPHHHVDAHVHCAPKHNFTAWLIVGYTTP